MSKGQDRACGCERCLYCDGPLSPQHEHDHFPVPEALGGTETVPCCANCHDLKDRLPVKDWSVDLFCEAFGQLPPAGRILAAKLVVMLQVAELERAAA